MSMNIFSRVRHILSWIFSVTTAQILPIIAYSRWGIIGVTAVLSKIVIRLKSLSQYCFPNLNWDTYKIYSSRWKLSWIQYWNSIRSQWLYDYGMEQQLSLYFFNSIRIAMNFNAENGVLYIKVFISYCSFTVENEYENLCLENRNGFYHQKETRLALKDV